jgi:hypothetical protein
MSAPDDIASCFRFYRPASPLGAFPDISIAAASGGAPRPMFNLRQCSVFVLMSASFISEATMPDIDFIRGEIERMRTQVSRQRKEILQLQRAGIPTASAEALLQRMLDKVDTMCAERDRLKRERTRLPAGKILGGRT